MRGNTPIVDVLPRTACEFFPVHDVFHAGGACRRPSAALPEHEIAGRPANDRR
ncbi:hypothetical protein [Thauera sp. SDU_THAU2]|uniref:hypothetical protein n=1 Tax=Thauera sp. SDU_THAU2 TaxID=3136633 RepID=UPI00311F8C83